MKLPQWIYPDDYTDSYIKYHMMKLLAINLPRMKLPKMKLTTMKSSYYDIITMKKKLLEFNVIFIHISELDGEVGAIVTFPWPHALADINREHSKLSEKVLGARRDSNPRSRVYEHSA